MKYYYHHEIVKNGIKILQYLLAQQTDKTLIIKPEDFDIFEKICEHYQTDNIITKFQAAILKDLSYEPNFAVFDINDSRNVMESRFYFYLLK